MLVPKPANEETAATTRFGAPPQETTPNGDNIERGGLFRLG